ncbi:MAG TPA: hypothetical protein VJC16_01995 [Candidatus Nanoarchaeia archaeon]|nr:hypothetical protein [Candidatus Nanoarchaeia archaeon]
MFCFRWKSDIRTISSWLDNPSALTQVRRCNPAPASRVMYIQPTDQSQWSARAAKSISTRWITQSNMAIFLP